MPKVIVGQGSWGWSRRGHRADLAAAATSRPGEVGRFTVVDPELPLVTVAGAAIALGGLLAASPSAMMPKPRSVSPTPCSACPRQKHVSRCAHPLPELEQLVEFSGRTVRDTLGRCPRSISLLGKNLVLAQCRTPFTGS